MALGNYVYAITVTAQANTSSGSPLSHLFPIGDVWLDSVQIVIPSGHRGLTGLAITNGGTPIIPYGAGTDFLIGDDDRLDYDLGVEVDASFGCIYYNTDSIRHNFYLRFQGLPMALYGQQLGAQAVTIVPVTAA
jgi:hypothetical protein